MKKQPEITAQTRENLLQAFWSLYSTRKIEHITIKDITTRAGYNRSTFYEYFVDIYDVLNQLEIALLEYLKEHILTSLENGLSEDSIHNLAQMYEAKGDYLGLLLSEDGDPYFAQKLKIAMRPALVKAFGLPEKNIHTSYLLEFGMSAILGTLTYWFRSNKNLPAKEMVQLIRSMLAMGVMPEIQKISNRAIG